MSGHAPIAKKPPKRGPATKRQRRAREERAARQALIEARQRGN